MLSVKEHEVISADILAVKKSLSNLKAPAVEILKVSVYKGREEGYDGEVGSIAVVSQGQTGKILYPHHSAEGDPVRHQHDFSAGAGNL